MSMVDDDSTAAAPPGGGQGSPRGPDRDAQGVGAPQGVAADGRDAALRTVQVALIKEIDASITKLERARIGESAHERLE